MIDKESRPITPLDFEERRNEYQEKNIQSVVRYINAILRLEESVAKLLNGQEVEVFSSTPSAIWDVSHKQAISRFKEANWVIQETELGYCFSLPIYPIDASINEKAFFRP